MIVEPDPDYYTLTIRYVYADGTTARPTVTRTRMERGDRYSVTSPVIEGYTADLPVAQGVMPARNARHGKLYTWKGTINIKNEKFKLDERPIDPTCTCPACRSFSRAYLRHLVVAQEMLAMRLAVLHNLHFYNELMVRIREHLDNGTFEQFRAQYSGLLDRPAQEA